MMRATRRRIFTACVLVGACNGMFLDPPEDCATTCALADDCGFLPSGLGDTATRQSAQDDCMSRCEQSSAETVVTRTVINCFAETRDSGWCRDPDAANHALGQQCSAAAACFDVSLPDANVIGPVTVELELITYTAFVEAYDEAALAALYAAAADDAVGGEDGQPTVTACTSALCGDAACRAFRLETADDSAVACDGTLCGQSDFQISTTCEDLAAERIELLADQGVRGYVSQVAYDNDGACTSGAASFESADYDIRPGPLAASARVYGTRLAGDLATIGYPIPADAEDDAPLDYCLEFPGQRLLVRSGANRLVVPIGSLDEIAALGLTPTTCAE